MDRRKFLVGLGSVSVGGSALIGTGAFTRVEAQRRVKIQIAEDPDAYLGLDGCPESPNSSYTEIDEKGHLAIEMSPENPTDAGGYGINSDSLSWFHDVFQIRNQGKQEVCVWIEDHEDWPRVHDDEFEDDLSDYDGMRRVSFYLGDDPTDEFIGQDNWVVLGVGEAVCVGLMTVTKGLSEGDQLLDELDNEIVINADAECEEPLECPVLSGEYECTTYEDENGNWVRTGTRFRIYNDGPATTFSLATADQPGGWRGDVPIDANTDRSIIADASFPWNAVLAWDPEPACKELLLEEHDLETWGEYKDRVGVDDLTDWYESFGHEDSPGDAPDDLDDELVVEVKDIPEIDEGNDPGDRVGPDEEIDDEMYPDMSEEAEELGWITCAKHDAAE